MDHIKLQKIRRIWWIITRGMLLIGSLYTLCHCRADDGLRATIKRIHYTQPDYSKELLKQIQTLMEAGFELSWKEPETREQGYIWAKYESLPWIRLHAKASPEETAFIRRILGIEGKDS